MCFLGTIIHLITVVITTTTTIIHAIVIHITTLTATATIHLSIATGLLPVTGIDVSG